MGVRRGSHRSVRRLATQQTASTFRTTTFASRGPTAVPTPAVVFAAAMAAASWPTGAFFRAPFPPRTPGLGEKGIPLARAGVEENPWSLLTPPAGAGVEATTPALDAESPRAPPPGGREVAEEDEVALRETEEEEGPEPPARAGVLPPRSTDELLAHLRQRVRPGVAMLARRLDEARRADERRRQAGVRTLSPPHAPGVRPVPPASPPLARALPAAAPISIRPPRGSAGRELMPKARPLQPPPALQPAAARPPLPAYFRHWDTGLRPKAVPELCARPSAAKRFAEGRAEGDEALSVRPRLSEEPLPMDDAPEEAPPVFGALSGAQQRRLQRELDARALGLAGLLQLYVDAGHEAFGRAAREQGCFQD